jgi:hypothetical protein
MKRIILALALFATPALAQQSATPPPDPVQDFIGAYSHHRSATDLAVSTTRETEKAAQALITAYQALKTENEKLKADAKNVPEK